jgi:hypothetical protein
LEEQSSALLKGRADWLEPFQNWILTARNAGEIAVKGSLQEKRVLAQKVFGSNLVLDCKKARGSCVKPWSALVETSQTGGMVCLYDSARTFCLNLRADVVRNAELAGNTWKSNTISPKLARRNCPVFFQVSGLAVPRKTRKKPNNLTPCTLKTDKSPWTWMGAWCKGFSGALGWPGRSSPQTIRRFERRLSRR